MSSVTSYNTIVTKETFRAESKLSSVDLNSRPIQDQDLDSAFLNCIRLETLKNLSSAEDLTNAFCNCTTLKTIPQIPSSCRYMNNTFENCVSFNSKVIIPSLVESVEKCFNGCKGLSISPVFTTNLITSVKETFKNTSLIETPIIPNNVSDMTEAFYNCKTLVSVSNFPTNAEDLSRAFYNCANLESIPEIPENVTNLEEAFYNCGHLVGDIVIRSSNVQNVKNCFFLANTNVRHRDVYIPFDSVTYQSFVNEGYSSTERKHGVLLIPLGSHLVTIRVTSGNSLGTVGVKRTFACDKDNKIIGFISPEYTFVYGLGYNSGLIGFYRQENKYTDVDETEVLGDIVDDRSLAYDLPGNLIGYVFNDYIVYDKDGTLLGYVNENDEILGVSDESDSYDDEQPVVIGYIRRGKQLAFDLEHRITGYVSEKNNVKDFDGNIIGRFYSEGIAFEERSYDVLGHVTNIEGRVVYNNEYTIIGYIDENGIAYNLDHTLLGTTDTKGNIINENNQIKGYISTFEDLVYDNNGCVIGWCQDNGVVRDFGPYGGKEVGMFDSNNNLIGPNLQIINGYLGETRMLVYDKAGVCVATLDRNGNAVDFYNNVIGKLDRYGNVIDTNGETETLSVENSRVTISYNGVSVPCTNSMLSHKNNYCFNGCSNDKFFVSIPDNTDFTYTVELDKFNTYQSDVLRTNGSNLNLDVKLSHSESLFVAKVLPSGSKITIYVNGITKEGTNIVSYSHSLGDELTVRCVGEHSDLLSNEETVVWNTNENYTCVISLEKPAYTQNKVLYSSETGKEIGTINLYEDYIYEITCVGGGGGSSYTCGGAGSAWKGRVYMTDNSVLTMVTGSGGAGGAKRARTHDGSEGTQSVISGNGINIKSPGGHPGKAQKKSYNKYKNGYTYSPAPNVNLSFINTVSLSNSNIQRQVSWIGGTTFGQGGNGGHRLDAGEQGKDGYIEIKYVDKMIKSQDSNDTSTNNVNGTVISLIGSQGTYNVPSSAAGLYRLICVGGGGGAVCYKSATDNDKFYKATGGSGSAFEATIYLPEGDYSWSIGEGGKGGNAPSEATRGGNTVFGSNIAYGGYEAKAQNGSYIPGKGGENPKIENTCYEVAIYSIGCSGFEDFSTNTRLAGGTSVYKQYGAGGDVSNGIAYDGARGFIQLIKLA